MWTHIESHNTAWLPLIMFNHSSEQDTAVGEFLCCMVRSIRKGGEGPQPVVQGESYSPIEWDITESRVFGNCTSPCMRKFVRSSDWWPVSMTSLPPHPPYQLYQFVISIGYQKGPGGSMSSDYLTTHSSLSSIRRESAPGFAIDKKGCTRFAAVW